MTKILALAAAAGMMAVASTASAQAVNVTNITFAPGALSGTLHSSAHNGDVGIGRFEFQGNFVSGGAPFDYFTYCVDLSHYVATGSGYSVRAINDPTADAALGITATKINQLNALLTNAAPLLATATGQNAINISAATQMAVWEIMFETSASWSVTNPSSALYINAGAAGSDLLAAQNIANGYLANVAGTSATPWTINNNYQLKLLYSANQQSQVFLTAVPEPATWGMMIVGFGLVGGAMRRRRAATLAAA